MPSVLPPCGQAWQTLRGECGAQCAGLTLARLPLVLRRCKVQKGVVKLVEKRGQWWQEEALGTI